MGDQTTIPCVARVANVFRERVLVRQWGQAGEWLVLIELGIYFADGGSPVWAWQHISTSTHRTHSVQHAESLGKQLDIPLDVQPREDLPAPCVAVGDGVKSVDDERADRGLPPPPHEGEPVDEAYADLTYARAYMAQRPDDATLLRRGLAVDLKAAKQWASTIRPPEPPPHEGVPMEKGIVPPDPRPETKPRRLEKQLSGNGYEWPWELGRKE